MSVIGVKQTSPRDAPRVDIPAAADPRSQADHGANHADHVANHAADHADAGGPQAGDSRAPSEPRGTTKVAPRPTEGPMALALVDAGLKIGAHFAPEVEGVDMSNVMEAVRSGVQGKIIDVTDEEDGEHVEIYVE